MVAVKVDRLTGSTRSVYQDARCDVATIEKAIEIAAQAHAGVKDKQGQPYVLHPIRVMQGVSGESARIVAVLHDVVEDTDLTLDSLGHMGFSAEIIHALDLVTHRADQTYADYVIGCKANTIARQVKLSDLRDNSNLDRALFRIESMQVDSSRLQRYLLSYRFLTDEISESDYRAAMERLSG